MKRIFLGSTLAILAVSTAQAAVSIQQLDASGDNFVTYEEAVNAVPRLDRVAFNHIDANSDGRLSADEISSERAQTEFAQHQVLSADERPLALIDSDGDGFMSYDDLARIYPSITMNSFKGIDANGDNRLSYSEYYDSDTQVALSQCEETHFLDLATMDQNGDRFLNMDELKMGYPLMNASDFRTIDLNDDNRVSAMELLAPTAQCLEGKGG